VRQCCQAKTGIGDPYALRIVGENLRSYVHKWTAPCVDHLSSPLTTVHKNQLMNVGSVANACQPRPFISKCFATLPNEKQRCQLWG
jgi:hypothetical protein